MSLFSSGSLVVRVTDKTARYFSRVTLSRPSSRGSYSSWILMDLMLLVWWTPSRRCLMISTATRRVGMQPPIPERYTVSQSSSLKRLSAFLMRKPAAVLLLTRSSFFSHSLRSEDFLTRRNFLYIRWICFKGEKIMYHCGLVWCKVVGHYNYWCVFGLFEFFNLNVGNLNSARLLIVFLTKFFI